LRSIVSTSKTLDVKLSDIGILWPSPCTVWVLP
jgi:hypothetical protein